MLVLQVLLLDFQQDIGIRDPADIAQRYEAACKEAEWVCDWKEWHVPEGTSIRAAAQFEEACEAGEPVACLATAWAYGQRWSGSYTRSAPDIGTAVRLVTKACDAGVARGCTDLARLQRHGIGMANDPEAALALAEKACEEGDARGCRTAGEGHAWGALSDNREGNYFERGCRGGHVWACEWLDVDQHELRKTPLREARTRCEAGVASACTLAGALVLRGNVIVRNLDDGTTDLKKGCDLGDSEGCLRLARFHARGLYDTPDEPEVALPLYERACELGSPAGCAYAGRMLVFDEVEEPDLEHGRELLALGCEGEERGACADMASLLRDQPQERGTWLSKACALGHAYACEQAGRLLASGEYVDGGPVARSGKVALEPDGVWLEDEHVVTWNHSREAGPHHLFAVTAPLARAFAKDPALQVEVSVAPDAAWTAGVEVIHAVHDVGIATRVIAGDQQSPLLVPRSDYRRQHHVLINERGIRALYQYKPLKNDMLVSCIRPGCPELDDYDIEAARRRLVDPLLEEEEPLDTLVVSPRSDYLVRDVVTLLQRFDGAMPNLAVGSTWRFRSLRTLSDADIEALFPKKKGRWEAKRKAWWAKDRADLLYRQRKYDDAIAGYHEALRYQPGCGHCILRLANVYRYRGHDLDFLLIANRLAQQFPQVPEAVGLSAYYYASHWDLERARATREAAIDISKRAVMAMYAGSLIEDREDYKPPAPRSLLIVGRRNISRFKRGAVGLSRYDQTLKDEVEVLRTCYLGALEHTRDLKGKLAVRLGIDGDGTVFSVTEVKTDIVDDEFRACLMDALEDMRFPDGDSAWTAKHYTLRFVPE